MPRRIRPHVTVLLVLAVLLTDPVTVLASHLFTDVPDDSPHATGIEYFAATGITAGCTPSECCPGDTSPAPR